MKFQIGRKILIKEYQHDGVGVIEEIKDDYILVRHISKTGLKKYYIKPQRLTFIDCESNTNINEPERINIAEPFPVYLRGGLKIPDLTKLTKDNIICYKELESRLNTDMSLDLPGVYAWFFKDSFMGIPDNALICIKDGIIFRDYWRLRYIGKASGQSLKERIWDKHFNDSASVSTLRDSIGSLLLSKLGLHYIRLSKSYKFDNEEKLTNWMIENARVYYISTDYPAEVEKALIAKHSECLYFNLKNNPQLFKPLSDLRTDLKKAGSDKKLITDAFTQYKNSAMNWKPKIKNE